MFPSTKEAKTASDSQQQKKLCYPRQSIMLFKLFSTHNWNKLHNYVVCTRQPGHSTSLWKFIERERWRERGNKSCDSKAALWIVMGNYLGDKSSSVSVSCVCLRSKKMELNEYAFGADRAGSRNDGATHYLSNCNMPDWNWQKEEPFAWFILMLARFSIPNTMKRKMVSISRPSPLKNQPIFDAAQLREHRKEISCIFKRAIFVFLCAAFHIWFLFSFIFLCFACIVPVSAPHRR